MNVLMVGCCGLDCGECPVFIAVLNSVMARKLYFFRSNFRPQILNSHVLVFQRTNPGYASMMTE